MLEQNPLCQPIGTNDHGRQAEQSFAFAKQRRPFFPLVRHPPSIAVFLTGTVFGAFLFISGVFFNDWQPGPVMLVTIYPLSLWIVAGFMTVVRFLSYLDLRIRHEGWEVELLLRAEASRMLSRMA